MGEGRSDRTWGRRAKAKPGGGTERPRRPWGASVVISPAGGTPAAGRGGGAGVGGHQGTALVAKIGETMCFRLPTPTDFENLFHLLPESDLKNRSVRNKINKTDPEKNGARTS